MNANAGAATTKEDPPGDLHGVSLDRYAGVIAGLSEGLLLPDILRNEGVDPAAWPDAEDAWEERITDDEDGALQTRFDELLAGAQDRYGRPVKPLEDDVGVWLDFVRHMAAAEEPLAFMATLGLGPADVLRLHRRWASLIAGDPQVAAGAAAALGRAPQDLPRLTVGERRIPPPKEGTSSALPVNGRASAAASDEDEDADSEDPGEPALFGPLPGAVGEEASPVTLAAPPPAAFLAPAALPFASQPAPTPSEAAFLGPSRFASPAPPPAAARAPETLPSPREIAETAAAQAGPGRSTGEIPPDLLRRIAAAKLPFARAPMEPRPPQVQEEPSTLAPQPSPLGRSVLPFSSSAPVPHAPAPSAADSVLPFRQASQQPSPPARPTSAQPAAVAPPAKPLPAQAPVAPQTPAPTLTLEQYASMCAELAVFHDRQGAVFAKYGLADPRHRATVDAAWKERLRRFPSEKAEWDRRYWQYEASWRRARR